MNESDSLRNDLAGVCDICGKPVSCPEGYMLTTGEVVGTPAYWEHYYHFHKDDLASQGAASYEAFCRNQILRLGCSRWAAGQQDPWLVCQQCIPIFNIDRQQSRRYAEQWWESGKTFKPPGSGAVPVSTVNMGDDRFIAEIDLKMYARLK